MSEAATGLGYHPDCVKFFTDVDIERFWSKINKDGPVPDQSIPHYKGLSKCWVWNRPAARYPLSRGRKTAIMSHRASWILHFGEIPKNALVLHRCDNVRCANPEHLFIGTSDDNNKDRALKARSAIGNSNGSRTHPEKLTRGASHWTRTNPEKVTRGSDHYFSKNAHLITGALNPCAKLTEADVLEIRRAYAAGEMFQKPLADKFGVTQGLISSIIRRASWGHL